MCVCVERACVCRLCVDVFVCLAAHVGKSDAIQTLRKPVENMTWADRERVIKLLLSKINDTPKYDRLSPVPHRRVADVLGVCMCVAVGLQGGVRGDLDESPRVGSSTLRHAGHGRRCPATAAAVPA